MGVDLIEMATKAMSGLPVTEYPPTNIPADYVGVKVPQFSFSRLSGADPVLGVEMASTGEVACFGRTKYEAYIKGLIATGFRLPKKNILLSIGSFKDKLEMLPSIERLHKMGYNLFATAGTADYIQEHGIPVKFLEVLSSGEHDEQKQEYSLTQHLSNNLIDLYINLPSSNRFRRPANYMSRGYQTRRMAVDYQTPLVTNVKNAKLLIEAIARHYDMEISKVDFQEFAAAPGAHDSSSGPMSKLSGSLSLQQLLARSPFKREHITSVKQFSRADLHLLFTIAQEMRLGTQRQGCLDILKGRVLCTLFCEPSTRTSASFDAAMKRLGGEVVVINELVSSTQKGESIADTIRTLGCYGDAIVLRHPSEESINIATKFSDVPIINAGNGSREHPTQALLDIFTIREELGTVNGLNITFVGDLKYGRTVHSLCELLSHYDVTINLVSPASLPMPSGVTDALKTRGQLNKVTTELTDDIVASSDVMYCTRVQKERFPDVATYEAVKDAFVIDNKLLKGAKANMIVMHPLPRNNEINEEVDFDPRAAYFRQVSLTAHQPSIPANMLVDEIWPVHAYGASRHGHGSVVRPCSARFHGRRLTVFTETNKATKSSASSYFPFGVIPSYRRASSTDLVDRYSSIYTGVLDMGKGHIYDVKFSTSVWGEAISFFLQHVSVLLFCYGLRGGTLFHFYFDLFWRWVGPSSRLGLGSVSGCIIGKPTRGIMEMDLHGTESVELGTILNGNGNGNGGSNYYW